MENISVRGYLNDTQANSTALLNIHELLPIEAVIFAPVLFLELVAAVVSNALLLALVILACVYKLNNNINIYLFSFAIGGLIGAFDIFCLLVLVVVRRWILGFFVCNVSQYMLIVYNIFAFLIYFVISRDKLKGVKDPIHGRPTNKRAYINSVVVWVLSIVIGILFMLWARSDFIETQTDFIEHGNFICFGLSSQRVNERMTFILASLFVIGFWIVSTLIIVITISYFVRILLELRELKKLRLRFARESRTSKVIKINRRDKPLYRTGEERTAKSLAIVYFIQFTCIFISYGMLYIQAIRNFALPPDNIDGSDFQIYFVVLLTVQVFPCVNPIFLILSNKRLRIRVKELFKCTLNPEMEASPMHSTTSKLKEAASGIFALKTNKIAPQ